MNKSIYGYFTAKTVQPDFDPGLEVDCPFCKKILSMPIITSSFMAPGTGVSYFYRAHKECYESADLNDIGNIESICFNEGNA